MSLSERAILSHLSISCWTGQVALNTREFDQLDPQRDSIRHQIVDDALLVPLRRHARKIRQAHYRLSAPWDDNGLRLVPSQHLMAYTDAVRGLRNEYEAMIDAASAELLASIEPAYQGRYTEVKSLFGSKLAFYNVPDENNLPVLANTIQASVRDSIVATITADNAARTRGIEIQLLETLIEAIPEEESKRQLSSGRAAQVHLLWQTLNTLSPGLLEWPPEIDGTNYRGYVRMILSRLQPENPGEPHGQD